MFNVGDLIKLSDEAKSRGKKSAIMAWEHKQPGRNAFSGNMPKDSSDYDSWLHNISNSVAYCLEVDDEWVRIQFMHVQTPFWIHHSKVESCS